MADPRFIDLIIGTYGRSLDTTVSESTAIVALKVIAVVVPIHRNVWKKRMLLTASDGLITMQYQLDIRRLIPFR